MATPLCAFNVSISPCLRPNFPPPNTCFQVRPLLHPASFRQNRATVVYRRCRAPTATYNRNRNPNDISSQIADILISAGRFFQSSTGQLILWGGLAWLVLTGRIGILFDSFLILFAILTIVPVLAVVAFRWWVNRQLVQGTCPSCGADVTGLRNQPFQCMSCGNTVILEQGDFSVKDPSSATVDIEAKEIHD